ncbi:vWA domain-containing protein [Methanotorris formicicus]|uniref:von Willebrand factor type A n=1 Tax=Methanotorris formicicus Mc-S-70 TaxID=647171 RepID=H1L0I1_9EURY|nr:hypothetical protein [Methanotorris formicicus]EHP84813.1 von Willebrand factor type A [Methanotorris formicicus Mc-S-70]
MIRYDKYDKMIWNENKDKLTFYLDEKEMELIFYLFFKYQIEIIKENPLINAIIKNRHYKTIKVITSLDETCSLMATQYFSEKLSEKKKKKDVEEGLGEILKETATYIENISSSINTLCGRGKGEKRYTNPKKKLELAEKLLKNKKLNELVNKLGEFRRMALKKYKTKIKHFSGDRHRVKYGNDLSKLLLNEIKNLSDDILYIDFLKRFSEHRILNYEILNNEKSKGDFVVCLDLSGSMGGAKEVWGKAIALSLLEISLREKRKFVCVLFDDGVREIKIFDKRPNSKDIIEFASIFFGGGTDFEKPLKKALEFNGNIVFITDGECEMSKAFIEYILEEKHKRGIKIFSFCINTKPTVSLKKVSDEAITIYQLTSKSAEQVFDTVLM